jgi:hypothetical protein
MNGLDPGPCGSKWVMHVTEEGEGPSQRFGPPDSLSSVSKDLEGMKAS